MALNDILSAMRVLILDADDGPVEAGARREWIGRKFPGLTSDEADDLANVPAERFGVYTETIFAGERSMLRWAFPMSMAVIGRMLHERDPSQSAGHHEYDFVRAMHRHGPWRSHSVRDLARCFQSYVVDGRQDLVEAWPGLADLAAFELAEVGVFYATDEPVVGLRLQDWASISVEALLMMPIVVPAYVVMMSCRFDVLAFREAWQDDGMLPASWPADARTFVACGREPESLRCRWAGMDAASFTALSAMPRGDVMAINDLAQAWLGAQSEGAFADESAAFGAFCERLAEWARCGVLMGPA
ncbi:MAG: hypothetical protein H6818_21125 [Phycisphaerales bacterium]|nr:hypothetical protein [Phycisphaerales bacterium]MCB9862295.1 hypothetical protein [Phycisphaerales bacterium]